MILLRKQDSHNRSDSLSSISKLRTLLIRRKSDNESSSSKTHSFRDANTQQSFIGQTPTTHRPSTRSSVLAWRSQVAKFTSEERQSHALKQFTGTKKTAKESAKGSSSRLPLPGSFLKSTEGEKVLREQPSMSFPHHLRIRSQPATSVLPRNSIQFPLIDDDKTTSNRQPWWDSASPLHIIGRDSLPYPEESEAEQKSTRDRDATAAQLIPSVPPTEQDSPSIGSSSTLSASEVDHIAAEAHTISDASFITCHSSPIDTTPSEGGSTPTLCQTEERDKAICKDACQSPLCDGYIFSADASQIDEFAEQSHSIEECYDQLAGLAIDDMQESVREFVASDHDGRQERLQRYSSNEHLRDPAEDNAIDGLLQTSKPTVKKHLSLSDFLHELRGRDGGIEPACFDESFGSGSFDDDEDAAQICHAWRETIAFAGLGASLLNGPLQGDKIEEGSEMYPPRKRPLQHKASKVSLQALDLDTIQEASFDSQVMPPDDSLGHIDICAHLLRRAIEEKRKTCKTSLL